MGERISVIPTHFIRWRLFVLKKLFIVTSLLLVGAFLNSRHSPTNAVVDHVVDRVCELANHGKNTAVGLASDVRTDVSNKRN